jgi:Xaa-Pro aminopeptidase
MSQFDLPAIQESLCQFGLDGWLLYDFRGNNVLARRVLDLAHRPTGSRRFFYFIPKQGEPRKLVHRIEPGALDHLPGEATVYLRWQELEAGVEAMLGGATRVAMEYAPRVSNPYIARIDAGVIELVRSTGAEVEPSGDLIQQFEASWSDEQWAMHQEATRVTTEAFNIAFGLIAERTSGGGSIRETEVQRVILDHFERHDLTTYSPPIVAVGPHSGDPHYEPKAGQDAEIREGEFVLIDLWGKCDRPGGVYSDLTRVGFVGREVPERFETIFQVVARARDAAIARVRNAFQTRTPLRGFEVDDAARHEIEAAGHGEAFIHRTGHSIGEETHGNGANMDNLETHETRLVLPRTCFSIEPGIYLPEFGIRSEVDVFIDADGEVHVTGGLQTRVLPILSDPTASGR